MTSLPTINRVSNALFYTLEQKKLRFTPPTQTDPLVIVFDTPQNWVAAGNTITATTGDKIFIPNGNAYTHASATVVQLPAAFTTLNTSTANGDVDNVLSKYIFCPATINAINDIPHTRDVYIEVKTVPSTSLDTGTAQAGAAATITLQAGASAVDDAYNGATIKIDSGTGSGQYRTLSDYVGATKVATVSSAWTVTPDATSVYTVSNGTILGEGGGHVRLIGGKITCGAQADPLNSGNRGLIRWFNAKYSTYYEGIWFDTNNKYGRDGVEYGNNGNAASGASPSGTTYPDVYVQNCRFDNVYSMSDNPDNPGDTTHADMVQPYGRHRFVFVDRLTGASQYQGLFFDPQHAACDYLISNVNIRYLDAVVPDSEDAGFALYWKNDSGAAATQQPYIDFYLSGDIWAQKREFFSLDFESASVYPQATAATVAYAPTAESDAETGFADGIVTWPTVLGVRGVVNQSSESGYGRFGDFVVADRDCGASYVSPGYQTDGKPFYYDTEDCQFWIKSDNFYYLNTGSFGDTTITSIKDLSQKDIAITSSVNYMNRYAHGRKLFGLSTSSYIDSGLTALGTTNLMADSGDAFYVYVVVNYDGDGYLLSKAGANSQFGIYVSGGNLYGVCRGSTTTIKSGLGSGLFFVSAHWTGSNLEYQYNDETPVSGNVGSGSADSSERIVFGAKTNATTDFFDGGIASARIYDVTLTGTQIENLWSVENEKWNIDGAQTARPSVPSAVQSLACPSPTTSTLPLTWSAPASNGGAAVQDYVIRYKTTISSTWSFWQLSTISTTASTTITGLTTGTSYDVEVYAANAVGWSPVSSLTVLTT